MMAAGIIEKQYIIWVKNNFVMGHANYHWNHVHGAEQAKMLSESEAEGWRKRITDVSTFRRASLEWRE